MRLVCSIFLDRSSYGDCEWPLMDLLMAGARSLMIFIMSINVWSQGARSIFGGEKV